MTELLETRLFAALRASGISEVPDGFSVAVVAQEIPADVLAGIDEFVRVFNRVTTRASWQQGVTSAAPHRLRRHRPEVCFFSAWDFHLPAEAPERWQLIEFNDNGSGFLFAALINHHFHELSGLADRGGVEPPPAMSTFSERLLGMIEREAKEFPGEATPELFLILDDPESLARGKFRDELLLLRDLLRSGGWRTEIATPEALRWNGRDLLFRDRVVSFVVNRSTDFSWEGEAFSALWAAYGDGRVYVAQRMVPKQRLPIPEGAEIDALWTDLRVWAYRDERYLISGRGSRRPDAIDLQRPGGWLPTYAANPGDPGVPGGRG